MKGRRAVPTTPKANDLRKPFLLIDRVMDGLLGMGWGLGLMPAALDRIYRIFQNYLGCHFRFFTAKRCEMREVDMLGLILKI